MENVRRLEGLPTPGDRHACECVCVSVCAVRCVRVCECYHQNQS